MYVLLFKTSPQKPHVLISFKTCTLSTHVVRLLYSKSSKIPATWSFCTKTSQREIECLLSFSRLFLLEYRLKRAPEYDIFSLLSKLWTDRPMLFLSKNMTPRSCYFFSLGLLAEYIFKMRLDQRMMSLFKKHSCDFMCRVYLKIPTYGYMSFFCLKHLFLELKTQKCSRSNSCCFCQNLLHLCLHVLRFSQIRSRRIHVLFVLEKQFMETDSNILPHHRYVCFCSVSARPKIRYLNRHVVCPNSFIQSSYDCFLQNPHLNAACSLYFLKLCIGYGFYILMKDMMACSVSALSNEHIQKYTCRGHVSSVQSPSICLLRAFFSKSQWRRINVFSLFWTSLWSTTSKLAP
jgi:hypothetical protein